MEEHHSIMSIVFRENYQKCYAVRSFGVLGLQGALEVQKCVFGFFFGTAQNFCNFGLVSGDSTTFLQGSQQKCVLSQSSGAE